MLVFILQRYSEWKKALVALVVTVTSSVFLVHPLHQLYVKNRVIRLSVKLAETRPDIVSAAGKIESLNVVYRDGVLHMRSSSSVPRNMSSLLVPWNTFDILRSSRRNTALRLRGLYRVVAAAPKWVQREVFERCRSTSARRIFCGKKRLRGLSRTGHGAAAGTEVTGFMPRKDRIPAGASA